MRIVLQKSLNDCGLACLAMLAEHCGKLVDYDALLSRAPEGMWEQGVSMKKLREIAVELGLETQAYHCPSHKLHRFGQPAIAHCLGNHFVVVQRCSDQRVEVIDPRYGRIALSADEFAQAYSGVCLLAEPAEGAASKFMTRLTNTHSSWQREMKACFLQWMRTLLAVAALHVAIMASALVGIAGYLRRPGAALLLAVAAVLWGESLLLARLLEPLLLRSYARIIRKIAALCSPEQGHLTEIPGGYRLSERMRWMAEQMYNSRDNFLELARFVTGLLAMLLYCLLVRDLWMSAAALAFGAVAAATGSWAIRSLPLSEEEHSERRFIELLLQQFMGGVHATLPRLKARGLGAVLNQRLAVLAGGTAFVGYWLLTVHSHSVTEFLILGAAQLKLLDWWKAAVPAATSCRIIHHCYEHMQCMHIAAQAGRSRAA